LENQNLFLIFVVIKRLDMEKGQKFIMKIDKYYGKDNLLKQGDVIEFVGNKRSSTGMLSVFKNQNGLVFKTYAISMDKFLTDYTNVL
jgi:hypothetical protein